MKKIMSIFLAFGVLVAMLSVFTPTASAAYVTSDYTQFQAPSSSDYAYWNGTRMVKASGTTTAEVKWMQASLNACIDRKVFIGTKLEVDGSFGPASSRTCKAFQQQMGLSADASFGPKTIEKMKAILSSTFTKRNYLQVDSSWSFLVYRNSYIRDSGCGILSIVNAVYNCSGQFIQPEVVADWAYAAKYFNQATKGGGICNNAVFKKAADQFGASYGFKYVSYGTTLNSNELKAHLSAGGTAIVHVPGHYMCLAGYDYASGKYLVFDSAPGSGTSYNSVHRKGLTSPGGDWKTISQLSTGYLKVDGWWAYGRR